MPAKAKVPKDPSAPQIPSDPAAPSAPLPVPATLGHAHRIPRQLIAPYSDLIEYCAAAPGDPIKAALALGALDTLAESAGGPGFLTSENIDPTALSEALLALIPAES